MRDLSLHVMDILDNSIRVGASVVRISVVEDGETDRLEIAVEDNGPGFAVPPEQLLDPFYTTAGAKRTGLGLSLFRASAEAADGTLILGRSELGGAEVRATMRLSHVDRRPLGDLAATLYAVACANPGLEIRLRVHGAGATAELSTPGLTAEASPPSAAFVRAREFAARAREALARLRA